MEFGTTGVAGTIFPLPLRAWPNWPNWSYQGRNDYQVLKRLDAIEERLARIEQQLTKQQPSG